MTYESKARYFPVSPRPLKMVAGLSRFGADFGQGERDRRFFQLDSERPRYLAAKLRAPLERHLLAADDSEALLVRTAALSWMRETLAREAPELVLECKCDAEARDPFDALARTLQEDFCVFSAGDDDAGRAVLLDVRFPGGWRPEQLVDRDFQAIHAPVPGFVSHADAAKSMVRAMVERGPFVRFVWTLSSDDQLDHHPDASARPSWERAEGAWLRVERQVTVPLPEARASVFLIRTYNYDLVELAHEQRACIMAALAAMPSDVKAYKGLPEPSVLSSALARRPS